MREPLEVFALDESFVRATGSIPYKSLRWVRRYTKPGEFEMVVPVNIYDPSWSYICCDLRPELGIIQKVQFDDDVQSYAGIDSVTLSGFFLESVLNNVVFLDESPEEQKVYVPEPKRPSYRKSQNPKVYHDNAGGWYYTNSSGQITDAETGRTGISEEGLTEVDYRDAQGTNWGRDTTYCDFDYYTAGDKTQINRVTWSGSTETYDVLFSDDRGNVFYTDPSAPSRVAQAVGVVTSRGDTYTERKRRWDALADDEYGSYYTVTVKGPWQRTDAMEPITVGDSIDIVFKWARRMMGNWLLYEEPTIEGVQKAVDPSFQYLGDLLYKTLYEVGASLRLEYLFLSNTFILSTYRGYDRTRNSLPEASAKAVPIAATATTSGIPDGYTQLEYVEFPGGNYVDTGYKPSSSDVVSASLYLNSSNDYRGVFGARGASGSDFIVWQQDESQLRIDYGINKFQFTGSYTGDQTITIGDGSIDVSGEAKTYVPSTFSQTLPMFIGDVNDGGSADGRGASFRVKSITARRDSTDLMNLVPAKSPDGVAGLYDTVSGTFLVPNTGSIVAGPEVTDDPWPSGYDALDYIEGTGTQYIDTGFVPNQDTRLVMDVESADPIPECHIAGARVTGMSQEFCLLIDAQERWRSDYGSEQDIVTGAPRSGRYTIDKDKGNVSIGEASVSQATQTFSAEYPLYVFAVNTAGSTSTFAPLRLYSCDVYDNGVLVRSFVPARRKRDSSVGLYDTTGGKFYSNAGTGAFVAGPVQEPDALLTYYANAQGATGSVPPQAGMVGQQVTVAQNGYSYTGHSFSGWGTLPGGGTIYQPGGLYTLTGMDDALYAQWESDEPGPGPGPEPPASTAPLAVFSDTWGTIWGYSASRDESNYKNTCYVLYEYDEPSSFDADGLPSVSYENSFDGEQSDGAPSFAGINVWIPYTTKRGYEVAHVGDEDDPAMETYLDIRNEKPSCDNQWSRDSVFVACTRMNIPSALEEARAQLITMGSGSTAPTSSAYSQWAESIPERGVQYLNEEYGVLVNLDTGTVNADGYLRDFDLGDMVDFEVSTVGLVETGRVIEVEEVYETPSGNKPVASINISIGDSLLTSTMAKHLT